MVGAYLLGLLRFLASRPPLRPGDDAERQPASVLRDRMSARTSHPARSRKKGGPRARKELQKLKSHGNYGWNDVFLCLFVPKLAIFHGFSWFLLAFMHFSCISHAFFEPPSLRGPHWASHRRLERRAARWKRKTARSGLFSRVKELRRSGTSEKNEFRIKRSF